MTPCAQTQILQRILIRKHLFQMDHVAIYATPYGLTDGRAPHLRHCLCLFSPFFLAGGKAHVIPATPKVSKMTKEETEQLIELVQENVALYNPGFDDYSNTSSSLKQMPNNSFQ